MAQFGETAAGEQKEGDVAPSFLDVASQTSVSSNITEVPFSDVPRAIPADLLEGDYNGFHAQMASRVALYANQGPGVSTSRKSAVVGGVAMSIALLLCAALAIKWKGLGLAPRHLQDDVSWEGKAKELALELSTSQKRIEALSALASKLEREVRNLQTSEQQKSLREEWLSVQETAYGRHLQAMLDATLQKHESTRLFLEKKDFSDSAVKEFKDKLAEIDESFFEGIAERNFVQEGIPPGGVFLPPAEFPRLRQRQWQADVRRARAISLLKGVKKMDPLWEEGQEPEGFQYIRNELAIAARRARNRLNAVEEQTDLRRAALSVLSGTLPDALPGIFTVSHFKTIGRPSKDFGDVRFQLGRVLFEDPTSVMFEAILLDSKVEKAIGSSTLAVKLHICRATGENDSALLKLVADRERAAAQRISRYACCQSQSALSPTEVVQWSGTHIPLFRGSLQPGPTDKQLPSNEFVYSPQVTFFTPVASSAQQTIDFLLSEESELSEEARLFLAQRLLRISAGLNLAGLCHNDHQLSNLFILDDGTPVLGSLAAASKTGERIWIPALRTCLLKSKWGIARANIPLRLKWGMHGLLAAWRTAYLLMKSPISNTGMAMTSCKTGLRIAAHPPQPLKGVPAEGVTTSYRLSA